MIEQWLAQWGVGAAVGFAFEKALVPLATDTSKDWLKDFCKGALKEVLEKAELRELKRAAGLAVKEFLVLFQQELEDSDLSYEELAVFEGPLKQYVLDKMVLEILGGPVQPEFERLDAAELNRLWQILEPPPPALPEDFDWQNIEKRYPKKVKAILRDSDKLRSLLGAIYQKRSAEALEQLAGVSPDFNLGKYREALLERYGNLNLESMDATGAYYELKLWNVFIPQTVRECREYLPQVYAMPKEVQARLKEKGQMPDDLAEWELESLQKAYQEQPMRSVLEATEDPQNRYMVVLGDPGSGKSTLLQYLALEWARKPLRERSVIPFPLLIELRTYARDCENGVCNDILGFCHNGNVCCRLNDLELKKQLDAGNATALFDGLDEVFDPARREEVITAIHRFSNEYPDVRIIVTSRVIGYSPQKLKDAEFRHFMLQDLDEEQVEEFINRWHDLTFAEEWEKERKKERLIRAVEDSPAIRQLAGNPLLLTMMAILNRSQELPRDRAELYQQCSRLLLHQWDIERQLMDKQLDYQAIDYKDKHAMLRRAAFFMQSSEKGLAGNLIYRDDLERIFLHYLKDMDVQDPRKVARLLIEQLRVRNFILCHVGADWYAFVHRTFLEFFCAWEFVRRFEKERKVSFEQLRDEVYGVHWQDESWHEVLRLIAGMIEPEFVGKILEYLIAQDGESEKIANLFLAAECLGEVRGRNAIAGVESRLLDLQKALIHYDLRYYYGPWEDEKERLVKDIRMKAVSTIARVWKNTGAVEEWLKSRVVHDDDEDVRQAAVQALVRGWKNDPDTLPWLKSRAIQDTDWAMRQAAVQELARGWKDDPDTLAIIKSRSVQDDDEDVRKAALQELVRNWKDDSGTLPIIRNLAVQDDDEDVRRAAVRELARGWRDDPDTLPIIKSRAVLDDDEDVRERAVQELARGWKGAPDTLKWLINRADQDESGAVRRTAVQELARGCKDAPDTLTWLISRAGHDKNGVVRRTAAEELARVWRDAPDTLPVIRRLAGHDKNMAVRLVAAKLLVRGWKDAPDTLSLLIDLADHDEFGFVRRAAVRELARGWKDDPDTLPWLKSRVDQDDDEDVRKAAVQELARGWKHDPDTLPWLKARAIRDDDEDVRHAAVQELARGWKNDPETLPIIKSRAVQDDDKDVRKAAIQELARGWKDDPETLPIIESHAVRDDDKDVRHAAVQELARGWKNDPETLPIIKSRAVQDDDKDVRKAAIQELARGWKDDPETLPIIESHAVRDDDKDVRHAAVQELARGWKNNPETLPIIKSRAVRDDDKDVRKAAVQELARGWKDDPETLPILKSRAVEDENWVVRRAAVQELARGWKDDPETLPILKSRAGEDENWAVRQAAVQELARGYKNHPETYDILCKFAINAPFELSSDFESNPRQTALDALIRHFPNRPRTRELLQDRAQNDPDEQVREYADKALVIQNQDGDRRRLLKAN